MELSINAESSRSSPGKLRSPTLSWTDVRASLTFLVNTSWLFWMRLYHTDLRMEAKGVTPIPAPTSITTS